MNWVESSTRALRFLAVGASSLTVFAAASADLWPGAAWAQESVNIQSESEAASVREIVVTAERRSESLKSVPISVQAFTAEQLERQGVTDTRDLASISPTINFTTGNSANNTSFSLRGISSISLQNGIQPSTAMVVDGVVLAKQAEFIASLADIDRIEVLNGPQGTLFGKNSTAGVINIVTKGPTDSFAATTEAQVTDDDEVNVRGVVNVPLSRDVRVRLTGFYQNQNPQVKNLTGPDVAGSRSYGANAKIAFDLSDKVTLLLSGTAARSNSTYGQLMVLGPNAFGAAQLALAHVPFARGATVINTDAPVYDPMTTNAVTATLNWNLADNLSLVSISNFTRFTENSSLDVDFTPAGAANGRGDSMPGSTYPVQGITAPNRFPFDVSYYSQEFRLNYQSGPLNTIVGAYYQSYRDTYSLLLPFNFDGSVLGGAANGFTPGVRYFNSSEPSAAMADRTASLFGDATYTLTDQVKFFAGLRETNEKIDVDYSRTDYGSPADLYSLYNPVTGVYSGPVTDTFHVTSAKTIHNLSGRAGIQFIPTQDLNFYASFARGYKGPAADVGQQVAPGEDPILKPEIATAYEIGGKLRLLDHRLAINAAVFHEVIDGIQEAVAKPGLGNAVVTLVNAGKLITRGFEGDAQFAVTPSIRLSTGLAYVKATYADFLFTCSFTQASTGTCPNTGGPGRQNITGDPAIGVPRWKYSLGADYEHAVGSSDQSLFGLVNYTWNSAIQSQLDNDPMTLEPSHGMLNAGIGLKGKDDRWEVQLFGKNLTNEFYYGQLYSVSIIGRPYGFLPRDFHRYVGLKIVNRF